jgi:hypothetical protein
VEIPASAPKGLGFALCRTPARGYRRRRQRTTFRLHGRTLRREAGTGWVGPQGRAAVIRRRHLIPVLGAVFTALVVCLGAFAAGATAKADKHRAHQLSKRQKAAARHKLQRQIRSNPRAVFRGGFLKKAQALDLSLPLTLRLRRSDQGPYDDALGVVWDSSTWAWPTGFVQLQPAAPSDPPPGGMVPLDGRTSVEAQFGNDVSGYDGPGVVETTNGKRLQFSSKIASPIPVTSLASCMNPSSPGVQDPTISALQLTRMDLVTGEGTTGLLSLFGGTARVSLHVRLATTTESLSDACTGAFGDGDRLPGEYDQGVTPPSGDPIVPISFDAVFRISPAIDADGKVRFGVLSLPAGATQPTTFARVSTCIQQATSGACAVVRFPARLSMSQLNAEVLLGDQLQ